MIYKDANDNIKLYKKKSPNKIDGVVAIVDAIGGMMSVEADDQKKIMYGNHSLRTIKI